MYEWVMSRKTKMKEGMNNRKMLKINWKLKRDNANMHGFFRYKVFTKKTHKAHSGTGNTIGTP